LKWLAAQKLDNYEQRIAFDCCLQCGSQESALNSSSRRYALAPVVEALQALRGIDLISAVVFMSEIGDLSRFASPRQLMAFLGLVPSKWSTGESVICGPRLTRRILVEAAWGYRHPPRVGKEKQKKVEAVPRTVREIAWKAQTRLRGRFRKLTRKGKLSTTVTTAVARELSAFIWAINRGLARKPCSEQKSQPRPHQACRRA
jgi:hypothetical protein